MAEKQVHSNDHSRNEGERLSYDDDNVTVSLSHWPEDHVFSNGNNQQYFSCFFSFCSRQWSNWTYAYMNSILSKGAKQMQKGVCDGNCAYLSQHDLFPVPESMQSSYLITVFQKSNELLIKHITNSDRDIEDDIDEKSLRHNQFRAFYKILWKVASPTFIPAGFCELVTVFCNTGLPLLVCALLRVIESNPNAKNIAQGLPYALAIFVLSIVNGLMNHRHRHLAMKTGVSLRAAVVNILYQHILLLSPEGRQGLFSGEITNLVAVETQKLFEVTQDGHLIWALPLSILLVSIFLYLILGPSTLVGIFTLAGFVPIIKYVTGQMLAARKLRTACSDKRVEILSSMLQGMQVTKLNHYEPNYELRLRTVRDQELKYLRKEMTIWAATLFIQVVSPVLATGLTFATYVLIDEKHILTAADTFGVLMLFSALRFPINYTGRLIGKAAQAISAVQRIAMFLSRPLRDKEELDLLNDVIAPGLKTTGDDTINETPKAQMNNEGFIDVIDENPAPLTLSRASFCIGDMPMIPEGDMNASSSPASSGFMVSEFNFSISRGEVVAVCGPVGSGKSTLVNGILEEARSMGKSAVTRRSKLSYVPQTPFIINRTLRENILFGLSYDKDRYEAVLHACCLQIDVEQLGEAGDMTEIGERGVTLSGGQKQRISLARCAYAQSPLVILDDPFSALDSETGKQIFERLISTPQAIFKNSAVLLVTHASHFLTSPSIDKLLLIVDGRNRFYGSWDEMTSFYPEDQNTIRAVEHIKSSVREEREEEEKDENFSSDEKREKNKGKSIGQLMQIEHREHGISSIKTWMLWFQRAGGITFLLTQIFFFAIDKFLFVAAEWFLARWTTAIDGPVDILGIEFPSQTEGISSQAMYLKVYASIILVFAIAAFIRCESTVYGGTWASRNVFYSMLSSILRAPMSYFETVPMGRILNSFTYDTDVNDVTLIRSMAVFMLSFSWYITAVIVQIAILPWTAFSIFLVSVIYWVLMLRYRKSGPDLQRIDALSRSPLQSMVSECLEGSTSIWVFDQYKNFLSQYKDVVDANSSAILNFVTAQRWLGIRMEFLGSFVVLLSSVLIVCFNDLFKIEAGIAGLLIIWSSNFTITLNFLVDTFSEAEAAITSIERVDAMADLPSEKVMETAMAYKLPKSWPEQGSLKFDKVNLRYREGLPLALKGLSFEIPAGKSCGVVGRTGAGKSSILVALFRLVEIESGCISLDGVDLSKIGLSDVRGRGLAIIPQDPFLAGASLRECLDPFQKHSDEEIFEALSAVQLNSTSVDMVTLLSSKLEEGGTNYSVGERQLLNVARALLSQPKVLLLDEATASIDGDTDAFIQKILRTRFPNTTLVTIAHRLQTIMDYDFCLVIDAGCAMEFGTPTELLDDKNGVFSGFVDSVGAENSKVLREMAKEAANSRV